MRLPFASCCLLSRFVIGLTILAASITGAAAAAPEWKEVYDPFIIRELHLQVDEADWDRVRFDKPQEGQTESLERAAAWFHSGTEEPILVEVRRKGATDPALPSETDPQKISLKIDINALVPGQRWHGLRKLSLEIGTTEGPLSEGFAWQIHRMAAEAGYYRYDAANATWVKLYINGSYRGVYTSTEQRDEQMLRNRDLYSPYNTWLYKIDAGTFNEVGEGDSPTKTQLNFSPFGTGGTTPNLDSELPQWIDMESLLTLAACEAFVENTDGLFTHDGKNSFAADFNPPNLRRRTYFPWDMDAAIRTGSLDIYRTRSGNKTSQNPYQAQILSHPWFGRIYEHTFRELLADKLSAASLHQFINQLEPVLGPALDSDPYAPPSGGSASAFNSLRNWATTRTANVTGQLTLSHVPRPTFHHPGGEVVNGYALAMSAPSGQIYYTTDGSDPRLPGGAVAPGALVYTAPVVIDRNTRFMARALDGANWSGLATEATFQVAAYATPLRISEIMYHPLDPNPGDAIDKEAYEFLELINTAPHSLDLSGFYFDGITYTFPPGSTIAGGARIVLVRNASAFSARYSGVSYHGVYFGALSNSGEKIRLKTADGTTVISVEYDDDPPWVLSPDGMGYSLVNRNLDGNPDDATNWRASSNLGGSPGAADPEPAHALDIVISEVLAHSTAPFENAVELLNTGNSSADLSGWFLSDQARNINSDLDPALLKKFRLPNGIVLPPGGYAAFFANSFLSNNPLVPFNLNPHGGRVFLSSADSSGNLTGTIIALEFPASDPNTSYGRVGTSAGPRDAPLISPTFGVSNPSTVAEFRGGNGAPNSAARVGPVVISEIMYNPPDSGNEFVELHNISNSPENISNWDIDGIVGFRFPVDTIIPAGGFVVLMDTANTTVADFRSAYNVPADTQVFGHLFDLSNGGESLRLEKPNPVSLQADILVERVRYNDKEPWPTEADGSGPSIERLPPSRFGNEPLHWKATTLLGAPGRFGNANHGIPIAKHSFWDVKTGPATLEAAWTTPSYNATAWESFNGPAGYGEPFLNGIVSYGSDPNAKYPTTYFRKAFVINDDPAGFSSLTLSMFYDDGVVVYLNGTEVARRNLPQGTIAYETFATEDIEATVYESVDLTSFSHLLSQGANVIAVEVHQASASSGDLVWDGELTYALASDPDDEDGDGLPRDWEIAHGLDDNDPSDALADSDGDGQSNVAEFLAGTDPTSSASHFHIGAMERAPDGAVTLQWASVPGKTYRVSYSSDLQQWFNFGPAGELEASGLVLEFTDPSPDMPDRRYYRITVVP